MVKCMISIIIQYRHSFFDCLTVSFFKFSRISLVNKTAVESLAVLIRLVKLDYVIAVSAPSQWEILIITTFYDFHGS